MRRRQGEAILIGDGVEIRILSIDGTRVKVGILAPRSVPVTTREIELVRKQNLQAAETPHDASEALAQLLKALPLDPAPLVARAEKSDAIIPEVVDLKGPAARSGAVSGKSRKK
jgi:carbon storage regulator